MAAMKTISRFSSGLAAVAPWIFCCSPILAELDYLHLSQVYNHLIAGGVGQYQQLIASDGAVAHEMVCGHRSSAGTVDLIEEDGQSWLQTSLSPPPHLLIVGGGVDAQPLAALAKNLGWTLSLWDSRPANARRDYFLSVDHILRQPLHQLLEDKFATHWDAAVVMCHNLELDAQAIKVLQGSSLKYLALLGPRDLVCKKSWNWRS